MVHIAVRTNLKYRPSWEEHRFGKQKSLLGLETCVEPFHPFRQMSPIPLQCTSKSRSFTVVTSLVTEPIAVTDMIILILRRSIHTNSGWLQAPLSRIHHLKGCYNSAPLTWLGKVSGTWGPTNWDDEENLLTALPKTTPRHIFVCEYNSFLPSKVEELERTVASWWPGMIFFEGHKTNVHLKHARFAVEIAFWMLLI